MATQEVLEYRLDSIEKSITELRDVIIETRLQRGEIDALAEKVKRNTEDIEQLKVNPIKEKAAKWQLVMDMVFKAVLTAGIGAALIKLGIQ